MSMIRPDRMIYLLLAKARKVVLPRWGFLPIEQFLHSCQRRFDGAQLVGVGRLEAFERPLMVIHDDTGVLENMACQHSDHILGGLDHAVRDELAQPRD